MITIDHERFGVRDEFDSLEQAQACLRGCGQDWADVTLSIQGDGVYDERGERVGEVGEDTNPPPKYPDSHNTDAAEDYLICDLCGAEIPSVTEAIDAGWIPDYLDGEDEICEPVCQHCRRARMRSTDEGFELIHG